MAADWQQEERTLPFFLHAIAWIVRHLGRTTGRLILPIIILWYVLFAKAAKQHSRNYLKRVKPRVRFRDVFNHFYQFAAVTLDRIVVLSGGSGKLKVTVEGEEHLQQYYKVGQGCLLLVSHVGSFDVMRVLGDELGKLPIKILMNKSISGRMLQVIDALNPDLTDAIIDVSERGPQVVFSVQKALDEGSMVGVMADRCFSDNEPTIEVPFLGSPAAFPQSPWALAAATKVPVVLCFGWYLGGNRYHIEFKPLTERLVANRRNREQHLQQACLQYSQALEEGLKKHPLNWFNFYDFWRR